MKILITDHAKSAMDDIVAYYSDLGYGKYESKRFKESFEA